MTNFFDCKGGPGTTEPACGACVTCLHRVIESKDSEIAMLKDRMKRLEEAGDAMHWAFMHPFDTANETVPDAWRKAKEAKP